MSAPRCLLAYDAAFVAATLLIAAVGVFGACRGNVTADAKKAEAVAAQSGAATAPATAKDATSPDAAAPSNPLVAMQPATGPRRFDAVVAERVRAGGYAYLRLTLPDDSERWLATMGEGQPSGARVTVESYGQRDDFHSRRTGKTFEHLLFGEAKPQV